MIDYALLKHFTRDLIAPKGDRGHVWRDLLEIKPRTPKKKIVERAIKAAVGNFNYWEQEGQIKWPAGLNGASWFDVVMGRRNIKTLNLVHRRRVLLARAETFTMNHPLHEDAMLSKWWWHELTAAYGYDPLRKRETLLWIVLNDLGFKNLPVPNMGCIDYNVITAFRHLGIVIGFEGNMFSEDSETQLRTECLTAIMYILQWRSDLTVSTLDDCLYNLGKKIRHEEPDWEKCFCYRFGCYYY